MPHAIYQSEASITKEMTQTLLSKFHRLNAVHSTPTQSLSKHILQSNHHRSLSSHSDLCSHPSPPHHRLPTISLAYSILPITPINTEAIRTHLPLNLRRTTNNSPTRIHQRPHLIRTPLPRRPPNLLIPQRLAQRIRNLPRMRANTIAPVVATASSLRRRASLFFGTWDRCRTRRDELLEGWQRALGELRGGRGGEGLQVVPHSGGVGAGFFADLGLLGGREAGHGDVFAAELGWSGLVIFVSFRVGWGLTWSK